MRSVVRALAVMTVAAGAATGACAQDAQYTSKDIIDSFAKPPAAAAQPDAQPGSCEAKGMATGDDGVCEPLKHTRGFSLPTRANLHAATAATPTARVASTNARPAATVHRATPAPATRRDLLITFKTGSSELTDQAKVNAKVFAQALNSPVLASSRFDLSGYTDAVGDKDKNLVLSQARAASVKSFLVGQGVDGGRLDAKGYGATDFVIPSDPMSARNRRVEAKRVD